MPQESGPRYCTLAQSASHGRLLIEEVKKFAASYRGARTQDERDRIDLQTKILTHEVAQESFDTYLQHACPVDLTRKDAEVCNTNPRFFIWPSERYFLTYRGVVDYSVYARALLPGLGTHGSSRQRTNAAEAIQHPGVNHAASENRSLPP